MDVAGACDVRGYNPVRSGGVEVEIGLMDGFRMIEGYRLPYLEGMREVPEEMRRHLGKATMSMLSPKVGGAEVLPSPG